MADVAWARDPMLLVDLKWRERTRTNSFSHSPFTILHCIARICHFAFSTIMHQASSHPVRSLIVIRTIHPPIGVISPTRTNHLLDITPNCSTVRAAPRAPTRRARVASISHSSRARFIVQSEDTALIPLPANGLSAHSCHPTTNGWSCSLDRARQHPRIRVRCGH